jgi:hypothetical protein
MQGTCHSRKHHFQWETELVGAQLLLIRLCRAQNLRKNASRRTGSARRWCAVFGGSPKISSHKLSRAKIRPGM